MLIAYLVTLSFAYVLLPNFDLLVLCSYQILCSNRSRFSCDNLCGNLLSCGNHYCTKTCHALKTRSSTSFQEAGEPCEDCHLPCEKVLKLLSITIIFLAIVLFISIIYVWIFKVDLLIEIFTLGKNACMFTSMPPTMSSWRMLSL